MYESQELANNNNFGNLVKETNIRISYLLY